MLKPVASADDRFYFDGLQRGELLVQRCLRCQSLRHPPSGVCPSCRSGEWEPVAASGRGELYSYVIPRKPALEGMLPTPIIALVELEEGLRMVSNLVGVEPGDARIGTAVVLEFLDVDDDFKLPVFRPAAGRD